MRWLHLSVIAIKTFMSSSNTFPSAPGCIALGMKPYSSQRSTNNCISKAWWSMLAPQVKYQLPGKFGVNLRPPVIVQLWLIGWFNYSSQKRNTEEVRNGGPWCGNSHTCWALAEPQCAERFQQASHVWQAESKKCFVTRDWWTTCLCVLGSQTRWLCDKEIDADVWPGIDQWRPSDPYGGVSFSLSSDMNQ